MRRVGALLCAARVVSMSTSAAPTAAELAARKAALSPLAYSVRASSRERAPAPEHAPDAAFSLAAAAAATAAAAAAAPQVTQERGTERAWTSELNSVKAPGDFVCTVCKQKLFETSGKFDSGSGWPSFFAPAAAGAVATAPDTSHGMVRVEATCARCGAHLGHVFDDGPRDKTGQRYCINGVSLDFIPK